MKQTGDLQQLNVMGIETRWGYKTFHLYCGDITRPKWAADFLALSVYAGDYRPVPGTVVQALYEQLGLNVEALASTAELDLRPGLGCWISKPTGISQVSRLLCVELQPGEVELGESVQNLFAALGVAETKGLSVRSVMMPVIGTGSLQLNPHVMMQELLDASLEFMRRSRDLEEIRFVEIDSDRASQLDEAMNSVLGRPRIVLPKGELIQNLSLELAAALDEAIALHGERSGAFRDLRRVLSAEEPRSFEIGVAVRRVAERVVADLCPGDGNSLFENIGSLASHGVAKWVVSYFHMLRVFGNEAAHENHDELQKPPHVDEADLAICLFCAQRVVQFWLKDQQDEAFRRE